MNSHRRLPAWREAADLVTVVYELTRGLPSEERFVAVSQLRRAAWSVQNNIAEGNARRGARELHRYFDFALGSLAEVDAMTATLGRIYRLDEALVSRIEQSRGAMTAGLFGILRSCRRPVRPSSGSLVVPPSDA